MIRYCLVLICITICLSQGISGEDIGKKEAVSTQIKNSINKFAEDDVKFNVVKREANPDEKARRRKNRQRKKNDSMKKRKRKNKKQNKKNARQSKQGNKKVTTKRKQENKKGTTKRRHRNKKSITKRRQGNKERYMKNRKRNNGQGSKKRNRKIKKGKKKKSHRNRKIKKNKQTRKKGSRKKRPGNNHIDINKAKRFTCSSVPESTLTISDGIKTFRKYFNHYKKINLTNKCLVKLEKKSGLEKLIRFNESAEWLEKVTDNGTFCSGSPINNSNVIETIIQLKKCGSSNEPDNPILYNCSKARIPNVTNLIVAQRNCINGVGPLKPFNTYGAWNEGFQKCFEVNPPNDCGCYEDMNNANNVFPGNSIFPSCIYPARNPPDWINDFNAKTITACKKCSKAVQKCKDWETKAANLTSICCKDSSEGNAVTNAGARRRMMIKASMMKKLQKINIK